jgi:hypothetical protein
MWGPKQGGSRQILQENDHLDAARFKMWRAYAQPVVATLTVSSGKRFTSLTVSQ